MFLSLLIHPLQCWCCQCIGFWPFLTGAWASQVAQWERICLPVQETQETCVRSLGQDDPLEEEMGTHSSILVWKIPWTEEPGQAAVQGLQRDGTEHLHFPGDLWGIETLMCLFSICISSLVKYFLRCLPYILVGLFIYLLLTYRISLYCLFAVVVFSFVYIGWRLITLQYCSGFCHTLTWIVHGFACVSLHSLDDSLLSDMSSANFSPSLWLFVLLFSLCLWQNRNFNLSEVQFITSFFYGLCLWSDMLFLQVKLIHNDSQQCKK